MKTKYAVIFKDYGFGCGEFFDTIKECRDWAIAKNKEIKKDPIFKKSYMPVFSISKIEYDETLVKPEFDNYDGVYGLHISDLKIYDTPKELGEFYQKVKEDDKRCISSNKCIGFWQSKGYDDREETHCLIPVTRPPQNYIYVEEL